MTAVFELFQYHAIPGTLSHILYWHILLLVGVVSGLTFIVTYARKASGLWYRYALGWHLMGMTTSVTVLLGMMLFSSLIGPLGNWWWIVIGSFLVVLLVQRTWIILRTEDYRRTSTQMVHESEWPTDHDCCGAEVKYDDADMN